jgi:putative ABC transport system permease protein
MIAWIADLMENVRVALDGLLANKMRSTLTMLGVIIGVGAVIALMSIGEGAQASITEQINSIGSNLIYVSAGAREMGPVEGSGGSASLTYDDARAIADPRNVPDAMTVAPQFGQNTQVIFGDENINVSVTGVTPEYQLAYNGVEVVNGRFIEDKDVDGRSNVAVLGYQSALDLFGGFDPLGQKIKVAMPGAGNGENGGKVSLTVVGVLAEQSSSGFSDPNEAVFIPVSTAQTRIFDGRNSLGKVIVGSVSVVAASEEQTDAVVDEITVLLRERHDIGPSEDDDFFVMNQADMLEMASQIMGIMTAFLGAIAGISLLVGGIGIMNIMLVSVTERTREIGLRKAVGARKGDILIQFLLEAVVLSVLGGLLGIVLGIGLGKLVDLTGLMNSVVTPDSIILAVGFSAAVGLFFGIYPANQAAKLNPIEALRYE